MKPVKKTLFMVEIPFVVSPDLPERVAAELLEKYASDLERDDTFRDHRRRRDRADVRAFDRRHGFALRAQIDRMQGTHQSGERLERHANAERRSARHPALGSARVVRAAHELPSPLVEEDLVVDLRSGKPRHAEAEADLHALRRLQAEKRPGEPAVELAVVMDVTAQSRREPGGDDLDDAAERVSAFLRLVDRRDDLPFRRRVGDADWRSLGPLERRFGGRARMVGRDPTDLRDPSHDPDAERREELLDERPDRDTGRRFARARSLEHVSHVRVVVLEDAGEVRMPWTRTSDRDRRIAVRGIGRHLLLPVLPIAVLDHERHRRAEGLSPSHARRDRDLVLLDRHATAPPIPLLTPPEIVVDRRTIDGKSRRATLENRREARPVRFPSGEEAKHKKSMCNEIR
jgi:hypothetical protein